MSKKLTEDFNRMQKVGGTLLELKQKKHDLEELLADNIAFKDYLEVLKNIDSEMERLDKMKKGEMYNDMSSEDVDYLEGTFFNLKLKKPYTKRQINLQKFIEKYPANTKMYQTWVEDVDVKGSISIEWLI